MTSTAGRAAHHWIALDLERVGAAPGVVDNLHGRERGARRDAFHLAGDRARADAVADRDRCDERAVAVVVIGVRLVVDEVEPADRRLRVELLVAEVDAAVRDAHLGARACDAERRAGARHPEVVVGCVVERVHLVARLDADDSGPVRHRVDLTVSEVRHESVDQAERRRDVPDADRSARSGHRRAVVERDDHVVPRWSLPARELMIEDVGDVVAVGVGERGVRDPRLRGVAVGG